MIYSNRGLVHGASITGKEDVHEYSHGKRRGVHAESGSYEQDPPSLGIVILNFFKAVLSPSMGQIHEQNKSQKNKQHSPSKRKILPPKLEETLRDEERHDDKHKPDDDFRSPVSIL